MSPSSAAPAARYAVTKNVPAKPVILDIRQAKVEVNLKQQILASFCPASGPRTLPTLLLYDDNGLHLFEKITYLDEYYLTNNEIAILEASAAEMAGKIPDGAMIVELGSGNLRKVNLLLQAFEAARKNIEYYALDLSRGELERTLAQLPAYEHVTCRGLVGTYDDGRLWLQSPAVAARQKVILTLGSSIGNFSRDAAADFLRDFADVLQPGDLLLVGLDFCADPHKVYHAYNDSQGVTHRFILNGLAHANAILGQDVFRASDWRVIGEYVYAAAGAEHRAFVAPVHETVVMGQTVGPHERIEIEKSLKYRQEEARTLWGAAGLVETCQWAHPSREHVLHLLTKSRMPFSLDPAVYARTILPSLEEWAANWEAWDVVTGQMLARQDLLDKPIKLRNVCLFYIGHLPTFLDIQLRKTTGEPLTEPADYARIFERGIDPDVDNPEVCHAHSEIPDEWPPLPDIFAYQDRVRARVRSLYAAAFGAKQPQGHAPMPRSVAQAVWVGFEHDLMHLETLLFMMLQSDRTLPPPGPRPDFAQMAAAAKAARVDNQWFRVPAQTIAIGFDDPDSQPDPMRHFVWDNEKPARTEDVHAFEAKGRPITNEEYAQYMLSNDVAEIPASWKTVPANGVNGTNGSGSALQSFSRDKAVRTVYGPVPLALALDWPVFASYDELSACAAWLGGRLPTFEEARSIYAFVEAKKKKKPSSGLFLDLAGANVGFHHWHPVAVTGTGDRLAGQAEMGGVWEWTSTVLRPHTGFEAMPLYPGYTSDFFDEKHNIILGGSWATHPRLAGRKSFVNWFQRNYRYAWIGGRLVKDV